MTHSNIQECYLQKRHEFENSLQSLSQGDVKISKSLTLYDKMGIHKKKWAAELRKLFLQVDIVISKQWIIYNNPKSVPSSSLNMEEFQSYLHYLSNVYSTSQIPIFFDKCLNFQMIGNSHHLPYKNLPTVSSTMQ